MNTTDDLNAKTVHEARQIVKEGLGGNSMFFDDDVRLAVALAQRAVLCGLADDIEPKTLANMQRAAEQERAVHEAAIGGELGPPRNLPGSDTAPDDERHLTPACYDCGLPYSDDGFADLVVADDVWVKISPTGHEGGLLCPTCMVRRAAKAGVEHATATFKSGPFGDQRATAPDERGLTAYVAEIGRWMDECFTADVTNDPIERNYRFLEEALELVQAKGCTEAEARRLVEYVYGRPQGDVNQEVGGVMVTLAALCHTYGIDLNAAAEAELRRVWQNIDKIRAKQAGKPAAISVTSPDRALPGPDLPAPDERERNLIPREKVREWFSRSWPNERTMLHDFDAHFPEGEG